MGCGESKHDAVATGNTIFRRKRSTKKAAAKDDSGGGDQKNPTPEKATGESNVAAAVDPARDAHVQEGQSTTDPSEHHATDVANNGSDVVSTVVEARDVKNDDDGVGVVDTNGGNNRDDEDQDDDQLGIDGVISDGRSGKSEYNTPPRGSSAESVNRTAEDSLIKPDDQIDNDGGGAENNIVTTTVDQELADNTDQAKPVLQEDQTGEEKSGDVEENVEKEELEVSVPAQEENGTITPNAEEKHVVDSPTKELKTL